MLFALNYYYNSSKNPIAYKYLTHGTILVPTFLFKDIKHININFMYLIYFAHIILQHSKETFKYYLDFFVYQLFHLYFRQSNHYCLAVQGLAICFNSLIPLLEEDSLKRDKIKTYTLDLSLPVQGEKSECKAATLPAQQESRIFKQNYNNLEENMSTSEEEEQCSELNRNFNDEIKPIKYYNNMYEFKSIIIKDNKNKSGIYKFTNKLNGNFYIGSSVNLSRRFINYYTLSYISKVKSHLTISRALIKYGYFNFELEILEYCDVSDLLKREQYYIDSLKPKYNISKIAGSTLGVIKSKEQRDNISKALKGKYVGDKSALFGRTLSSETKNLMSA